jgi:hypothetical protein
MRALIDINRGTIMSMLRTDLEGFQPKAVEDVAKDVHHLVSGGDDSGYQQRSFKIVNGYGRNKDGFIMLFPIESNNTTSNSKKKTAKKK